MPTSFSTQPKLPELPRVAPISLPGLDQGIISSEADRASAQPLRELGRGVREAVVQAGSEFGDDPLAYRFGIKTALRGYQDALGPTLQAAHNVGLDRAQAQQAIGSQEAIINQQQENAAAMAQWSAQVQALNNASMQAFQKELAQMQIDANAAAAATLATERATVRGDEPVDPNNVFQVPTRVTNAQQWRY